MRRHPTTADAALGAAHLGAVDLGAGVLARLGRGVADRHHALAASVRAGALLVLARSPARPAPRAVERPRRGARSRRPRGGTGRARTAAPGRPRTPDPGWSRGRRCGRRPRRPRSSGRRRAVRDHERATCCSGGGIGETVPRSGQVPTTTCDAGLAEPAYASERCRTDAAGSTEWVTSLAPIRITATSGSVAQRARRPGASRSLDWAPTTGERAQVHASVRRSAHARAASQARAGGLLDTVHAVAGGAAVAEEGDLDRRARPAAAVPPGGVGQAARRRRRRWCAGPAWPRPAGRRTARRRAPRDRRRRRPRPRPACEPQRPSPCAQPSDPGSGWTPSPPPPSRARSRPPGGP